MKCAEVVVPIQTLISKWHCAGCNQTVLYMSDKETVIIIKFKLIYNLMIYFIVNELNSK